VVQLVRLGQRERERGGGAEELTEARGGARSACFGVAMAPLLSADGEGVMSVTELSRWVLS
jgi:hypothetical protein